VSAGDYVQLTVADTGEGIHPDVRAHLFEPFFTTKPPGRGAGLGLATVHGIVAQNGGGVRAESSPGAGSTFRVILPRHQGASVAADAAAPSSPQVERGAETILVVEDEAQILRLTTTVLERAGYRLLPAATPAEALERAGKHDGPIHLVVTDVVMPGMHGQELVERLAALRPGIRSIFMSGYTADVMARDGVIDHGVHFIQKPFRGAELCDLVRDVLDTGHA
jgi:CheY-like chemotaxis protein